MSESAITEEDHDAADEDGASVDALGDFPNADGVPTVGGELGDRLLDVGEDGFLANLPAAPFVRFLTYSCDAVTVLFRRR